MGFVAWYFSVLFITLWPEKTHPWRKEEGFWKIPWGTLSLKKHKGSTFWFNALFKDVFSRCGIFLCLHSGATGICMLLSDTKYCHLTARQGICLTQKRDTRRQGCFVLNSALQLNVTGKSNVTGKKGAFSGLGSLGASPFGSKSWRNCKNLKLTPLQWKVSIILIVCSSQIGNFLGRAKTT